MANSPPGEIHRNSGATQACFADPWRMRRETQFSILALFEVTSEAAAMAIVTSPMKRR